MARCGRTARPPELGPVHSRRDSPLPGTELRELQIEGPAVLALLNRTGIEDGAASLRPQALDGCPYRWNSFLLGFREFAQVVSVQVGYRPERHAVS